MNCPINWDRDCLLMGLGLPVRPIQSSPPQILGNSQRRTTSQFPCDFRSMPLFGLDVVALLWHACACDAVARALPSHSIVRPLRSILPSRPLGARTNAPQRWSSLGAPLAATAWPRWAGARRVALDRLDRHEVNQVPSAGSSRAVTRVNGVRKAAS